MRKAGGESQQEQQMDQIFTLFLLNRNGKVDPLDAFPLCHLASRKTCAVALLSRHATEKEKNGRFHRHPSCIEGLALCGGQTPRSAPQRSGGPLM
jgi:hypothetical protein